MILLSLHNLITDPLVTPFKQNSPDDVQTSLFVIIKKFVELQVDTNPLGSYIRPSSTPRNSASIQALIQFILLNEFILGS